MKSVRWMLTTLLLVAATTAQANKYESLGNGAWTFDVQRYAVIVQVETAVSVIETYVSTTPLVKGEHDRTFRFL
jgi:hypothetical protein